MDRVAGMDRLARSLVVMRRHRPCRRGRERWRGKSQGQHDQKTEKPACNAHKMTMLYAKALFNNAFRRSVHRPRPSNAAPPKVHIETA